ncbi:MAG: helix-turn-helix domain-containing protein [Victivallaceae bacterium]
MDKTAEKPKPQQLFERELVAGETDFQVRHREPLLRRFGVDRWIVNLTLSGAGRINRGRRQFLVRRGDLLLFPPGVIHDYAAEEGGDWVHLWCYFDPRPDWGRLLSWPDAGMGVRRLGSAEAGFADRLEAIFRQLLELEPRRLPGGREFCLNKLEELLLWANLLNPAAEVIYDEKLNRCLAFIAEHLDRPLSLADLAARCHLSTSRFAHWFREREGMPPMRYLELRRIEKARELLTWSGLSIAEVASTVGYNDPLHFSRVYKKHTGQSPRDFRTASR